MHYRACYPLLKLVYSAATSAIHNMGLSEASLIIIKVEVNKDTAVKKLKPQARGCIYPIKRPIPKKKIPIVSNLLFFEWNIYGIPMNRIKPYSMVYTWDSSFLLLSKSQGGLVDT
jgi:hypothetical protein